MATNKSEFLALRAEIDRRLKEIEEDNKKLVQDGLKVLFKDAADFGISPEEILKHAQSLVGSNGKPKIQKETVVKYRNQNGDTWSGGPGPRPKWIKEATTAGEDLEKYRVA